jgi:hypothetical protein
MSNKERAEKAAEALSDLNMLHAIKNLCESSLFYTTLGKSAAMKISRLCSETAQRQLYDYDKNMGAIEP